MSENQVSIPSTSADWKQDRQSPGRRHSENVISVAESFPVDNLCRRRETFPRNYDGNSYNYSEDVAEQENTNSTSDAGQRFVNVKEHNE